MTPPQGDPGGCGSFPTPSLRWDPWSLRGMAWSLRDPGLACPGRPLGPWVRHPRAIRRDFAPHPGSPKACTCPTCTCSYRLFAELHTLRLWVHSRVADAHSCPLPDTLALRSCPSPSALRNMHLPGSLPCTPPVWLQAQGPSHRLSSLPGRPCRAPASFLPLDTTGDRAGRFDNVALRPG